MKKKATKNHKEKNKNMNEAEKNQSINTWECMMIVNIRIEVNAIW